MASSRPTVLITGASGDLGSRLVPLLADYNIIGIDIKPPTTKVPFRFINMNLEREEYCRELMLLLRESRVETFVHLAAIMSPTPDGTMNTDRMWQINVAGTARVLEAITEANREEVLVKKFIFPSSTLVYGPNLTTEATEDTAISTDVPVGIQQRIEAERVVRTRGPGLRNCSIYILRSAAFAGAGSHGFLVSGFRPNAKGKRLSFAMSWGKRHLQNRTQFVHVDDMARLISYITHKNEPEPQKLTVLNVAGRGDPITYEQCLQSAHAKRLALPGKSGLDMLLRFRWNRGSSPIPPDTAPYLMGESLVSTARLRKFLGRDYADVIHYTIGDAFADSFAAETETLEASPVSR
jgi:nucleoside-diphosphate-sugar epimerase